FVPACFFTTNAFLKNSFVRVSGNGTFNVNPSSVQIASETPAVFWFLIQILYFLGKFVNKSSSLGSLLLQESLQILILCIFHCLGKPFFGIIIFLQQILEIVH